MTLYAANGTRLSKTAAASKVTTWTDPDPFVTVTEALYSGEAFDGTNYPEGQRELAFAEGDVVRQSQINRYFPDATIEKITPAGGTTAGGTDVTIRGTNFTPGTTVTFGGTAATSIVVKNKTTITCKTPAKTAGAVNVVVTTDAGPVTKTGGYTYS